MTILYETIASPFIEKIHQLIGSVDGVRLLIFEVSSARGRSNPASSSTIEILASQPSIQALHTVSSD